MKKCPYCAEQIQDEAIKCRYCHEFLDGRGSGINYTEHARKPGTSVTAAASGAAYTEAGPANRSNVAAGKTDPLDLTLDPQLQRKLDSFVDHGKKWYAVLFSLIFLGPFALPVVWNHPRYGIVKKTVITFVVLAVTAVVVFGFCLIIRYITTQLENTLQGDLGVIF